VLGALLLYTGRAIAQQQPTDACLNFDFVAPTAGMVAYPVSGGPLRGMGIQVDTLVGVATPLNDGVTRTCCQCTVDFTTGNLTGTTAFSWQYGSGGAISLVGGVDLTGNGSCADAGDVPTSTTLLSGAFTGTTEVLASGPTFKVVIGSFDDVKDDDMVGFYGLPTNVVYVGSTNLSFSAPGSPPSTFSSTGLFSGNMTNCAPEVPPTPTPTDTEEPTETATVTATASATETASATASTTETATQEPTETAEATETPEPTETVVPTETPEPTETAVPTETPQLTETPERTATGTRKATRTRTTTRTQTATKTAKPSRTATIKPTKTKTATRTPTHERNGEGCTPGFWKQSHHFDHWKYYDPWDKFDVVFGVDGPGYKTLLETLGLGGGGKYALGRHAVAALLNATSYKVDYAYTVAEVIQIVQTAYATGDFEAAKDLLEAQNEQDCPLDNDHSCNYRDDDDRYRSSSSDKKDKKDGWWWKWW
jgi:hypothetical protein